MKSGCFTRGLRVLYQEHEEVTCVRLYDTSLAALCDTGEAESAVAGAYNTEGALVGKTVWVIWDGASYALIVDLLQRGLLPHLQRHAWSARRRRHLGQIVKHHPA